MKSFNIRLFLKFLVLMLWFSCLTMRVFSQPQQQQVQCMYIFGDSLVDNGNNNGLITLSRANYRPYGIDFPQGASGRFTNGRTFVDALAQLLGFPNYIPPYARIRGTMLLRGANYASGASGIRDETGNNLGDHMGMNQQVTNFGRTVQEMRRFFRGNDVALRGYLSKCILYSGMGSNDYLNNYFMPNYYSTGSRFTPAAYAASLLQDYSRQLTIALSYDNVIRTHAGFCKIGQQLYNLGARKIIVAGVGQIGCIPYQLARYNGSGPNDVCNEVINNAIVLFNTGLKKMVDGFNKGQLPGANFVYLDSFQGGQELVRNAASYGFEVLDKGCCGVGRNNGQITCLPLQEPCTDRSKYLFWDAFHPTETANIVSAKIAFSTKSKSYAYPINIQKLAML